MLAGRYDQALTTLEANRKNYGKNNALLFFLDHALVLQFSGKYDQSIPQFEEAKRLYDELYTQSLSRLGTSWLTNDYRLPYRGEDFERSMINVFQAMNYAAQGDVGEALVEARQVHAFLTTLNDRYPPGQRNVYADDAFIRGLMGMLYVAGNSDQDLNDAFISLRRAITLYEGPYRSQYGFTSPPKVFVEDFLTACDFMGGETAKDCHKKFAHTTYLTGGQRSRYGQIILVIAHGHGPVKVPKDFVFPLPNGYVARMSFPSYRKQMMEPLVGSICAEGNTGCFCASPELVQDIQAIAEKDLESRRLRVMIKAGLRPVLKYALARTAEEQLRQHGEKEAAEAVRYAGIMYGLFSEQADLRSWQLLPAQIWLARVFVLPGEYQVLFGQERLTKISIQAGETRFFIHRTW